MCGERGLDKRWIREVGYCVGEDGEEYEACVREECTLFFFFFCNDTATAGIYTLSLHDALPIWISSETLSLLIQGAI